MIHPNIVIIISDTLRNDYFRPDLFPRTYAKLFQDGELYQNVISPASWTVPSHASIFTKQYPSIHKIHKMSGMNDIEILEHARSKLGFNSFVRTLSSNGYFTFAYSANPFISSSSIFSAGFDLFIDSEFQQLISKGLRDKIEDNIKPSDVLNLTGKIKLGGRLVNSTLKRSTFKRTKNSNITYDKGGNAFSKLINNTSLSQPFFLFVNLMEMHEPYIRSEYGHFLNKSKWSDYFGIKQFSSRERTKIKLIYSRNTKYIDNTIYEILRFLLQSNIYNNTMIIVTSDHGQAFWEQEFYSHEAFLYDEIVRVPLLIKYPSNERVGQKNYENKFFSTVDLGGVIQGWSEGVKEFMQPRDVVFTESYGFNASSIPNIRLSREGKQRVLYALLPRKAVYKNGFKLIVNAKGEIEGLYKKNVKIDHNVSHSSCKELYEEIEIFAESDPSFVANSLPQWWKD
jgi:hypothetical protein